MKYNFSYKLNGKLVNETAERLSEIVAKLFNLANEKNDDGTPKNIVESLQFKHIGVNHAIA